MIRMPAVCTSTMRRALAICLVLCVIQLVRCDDACGEHGHLDEAQQLCVCDNPWPNPTEKGWTGKKCDIPVFGGQADGQDMSSWCQGDKCNTLQACGAWVAIALSSVLRRRQEQNLRTCCACMLNKSFCARFPDKR